MINPIFIFKKLIDELGSAQAKELYTRTSSDKDCNIYWKGKIAGIKFALKLIESEVKPDEV